MGGGRGKIHPATRTFQALRIFVNDELKELDEGLNQGYQILENTGTFSVISFHSLEDRIVKDKFRQWYQSGGFQMHHKKPIAPGSQEKEENVAARSGKIKKWI